MKQIVFCGKHNRNYIACHNNSLKFLIAKIYTVNF